MPFSVRRGVLWFVVVDEAGAPIHSARILGGFNSEGSQAGLHEPRNGGPQTFTVEINGVTYEDVPFAGD